MLYYSYSAISQQALRRVIVNRPNHIRPLVIVNNDFDRSAEELAALYKKRWDIELFFKWVKQNLKVKTFLVRSENAIRTHIYRALISYLLLHLYRNRKGCRDKLRLTQPQLEFS